jgi:hypothetical protein
VRNLNFLICSSSKFECDRVVRSTKTFTWEGLNYHVPTPSGPLRLLHDVYGYVKPGTLTALMGASGAGVFFVSAFERWAYGCLGKTTCLDVLAQRKNVGVVSGDVLVDGRPLNSDFARGTAYGVLSIGSVVYLSYLSFTQRSKWTFMKASSQRLSTWCWRC